MELLGDPPGAKMAQDAIWDASGALLGGPLGRILAPSCGQDGATLPNLAPRWAQDGQLGGQDGQLGALLGASWQLFLDLGRDLAKNCETHKNDDSTALLKVFWGPGAALGGYVGSSWRYVGLCWAIWTPSWSNLATRLPILGDVWTSWRQGWRTRAQDAADERNSWIFWRPGWGEKMTQVHAGNLGYPPLRNSKGRGWSSHLHLELPTPPGNS